MLLHIYLHFNFHLIKLFVVIFITYQRYFLYFCYVAVIVEEATEVIEAEIVASLFKACDQLIMLGNS